MKKLITTFTTLILWFAFANAQTLTISGTGVGNTAANSNICPSTTFTYTCTQPTNVKTGTDVQYTWSVTQGTPSYTIVYNTNTLDVTWTSSLAYAAGTITCLIQWTKPDGSSSNYNTAIYTIYFVRLDPPSISGATSVDYGVSSTKTYTAQISTTGQSATYTWNTPSGWSGTASTSNTKTYTLPSDNVGGTINVTSQSTLCTAVTATASLNVSRSKPTISFTYTNSVCINPVSSAQTVNVYGAGGSGVAGTFYYSFSAASGYLWNGVYSSPINVFVPYASLAPSSSVAVGSSTITVCANFTCSGCTATCVSNTIKAYNGLPTAPTNDYMQREGVSCWYNIVASGGSNYDTYNWSHDNFATTYSVTSNNNDAFEYPSNGGYTASYVKTQNGCGYSSSIYRNLYRAPIGGCVWKTDETDNTTDIAAVEPTDDDLKLYPVPAVNKTLNIYSPYAKPIFIKIYDISGREVFTYLAEQGSFAVELNGLQAGMYIARYTINENQKAKRIILQ
jgi:hypothetical protein